MDPEWTALLALLAINFASFSWAVSAHFERDGPMPSGMRAVSFLSLIGFGWLAFDMTSDALSDPSPGLPPIRFEASVIGLALSLSLFWWTVAVTRKQRLTLAFSDDVPGIIYRSGPFKYVRHPFYASYILFWASAACALLEWSFATYALMLTVVYVNAANREERKFASSDLGAIYEDYRSSTGMFLPVSMRTGVRGSARRLDRE